MTRIGAIVNCRLQTISEKDGEELFVITSIWAEPYLINSPLVSLPEGLRKILGAGGNISPLAVGSRESLVGRKA